MWQNLINVVRKIDKTVLPRTNHHVHNTGYVIFVTVVSPVLPLFIIRAPIKRMRNAISGVAWQLAGREGAASWKLAEYRV